MEVGTIFLFSGTVLPPNTLVCDGSAVSREDYASLFDVIGTTYGSGDGVTTFNLPDLCNRLVIGDSQDYQFGTTGGEESHTLLSTELPSHAHEVPTHGHQNTFAFSIPSLSHKVSQQPSYTYTSLNNNTQSRYGNQYARNPYKNKTNAAMSRSTNLSVAAHTATACTVSGGVTDAPAFDTESTGLGTAHDNMMPYLTLTYLIRYEPDEPPEPPEPKMYLYNGCLPVGPSGCYIVGKG